MMYRVSLLASAVGLICSAAPISAASIAEDAAAFGAREAVAAPRLSPDGNSVMYLTPGPGPQTVAVVSNLQSGQTRILVRSDGNPESLRGCNYSAPDRAVCYVVANVNTIGYLIGFQRALSMNLDGSDPKMLGQPQRNADAYLRQFDAAVLDWRGGADGKVLMMREYVPEIGKIESNIVDKREGLGVDLVDTRTLKSTRVEPPNPVASGYLTDGRGNVRVMAVVEERGRTYTGRSKYFYRTKGSREWKTLVEYQEDDFQPLAVDSEIDAVYALKKKNGRDALYTVSLDGSLTTRLVAENPKVDIDGVVRFGDGHRVIGYTYVGEKRDVIYFDAEFKALSASLSKALPKLPLIYFVDASTDGRKLLIFAGSDDDPGRFYLFDRDKKTLNEAMIERPQLEGRTLAKVQHVTYRAADGTMIPAYVTLPPGKDGKNLPAIVMPHGGPLARDEWGFDWLAQFLAARGYAVIQPQYRGSAGYGKEWANENGLKNWRTAMSDITDSARWLISQKIADPNRIAMFGWSYGGYSALMQGALEPSLYKAIIAIAPVTDLPMLKEDWGHFRNEQRIEKFVGSGPSIIEGSPLKRVAAIRAPVLLVHGDLDTNVYIRHADAMDAALRKAGKQVEYLRYKGLDHQLTDAKVRAEFLARAAQLLEKTIGH
jgi:dipeptidyl aminopeptidase/acylaminoacyl peptidase